MSKAITEIIKPIFQDLSKNRLLEKCLHGQTQNFNEAFKQLISEKCPNTIFTSKEIAKIAVSSTIINYNSGIGLEYIFYSIGMSNGYYFKKTASNKDLNRVKNMSNKTSLNFENGRKHLRSVRKEHHDAEREKEGGKIIISLFVFFQNLYFYRFGFRHF